MNTEDLKRDAEASLEGIDNPYRRGIILEYVTALEKEVAMLKESRSKAVEQEQRSRVEANRLRGVVEWVASQKDLFFAECSQAEEIVARCREAL